MEREAERARESLAKDGQAAETETPPSQEPPAAHVDETDEPLQMADEDSAPRQSAAGESDGPGVTRDPGRHAKTGPGKLRPKGAADSDA